jgi:hypothetical protein
LEDRHDDRLAKVVDDRRPAAEQPPSRVLAGVRANLLEHALGQRARERVGIAVYARAPGGQEQRIHYFIVNVTWLAQPDRESLSPIARAERPDFIEHRDPGGRMAPRTIRRLIVFHIAESFAFALGALLVNRDNLKKPRAIK